MRAPIGKKHFALGIAGAALLGLGATYGVRHGEPVHHTAPAASSAVAAAAATTAAAPREGAGERRWDLGASFVYAVTGEATVSIASQEGSPQAAKAKISGDLALTVIARSPRGVTVRADLRSGSFEQGTKKLAAADLAAPFYFHASKAGELSSFVFSKRLPTEARAALESLATSLEIVVPEGAGASWRAREIDATGQYEAAYRRDGDTVHKSKEKYLALQGSDGLSPLPASSRSTIRSAIDFQLDASGWPKTMSATETADLSWQEGVHMVAAEKRSGRLVVVEARPDLVAQGMERDVSAAVMDREEMRVQRDKQLVGGKSWKQLTEAVAAKDTADRNRAQTQLGAFLRLDPSAAREAEEAIVHGNLDDNAKKRMCAALGTAGTPEAQRALANVLGGAAAPVDRKIDAAIALAQVASPTPEAVAALDQAMGSPDPGVSSTATLATGAAVRQLNTASGNAEDSADTRDMVAKLIAGLKSATDDEHRLVFIQALGNTGDARVWDALHPWLTSPDVTLRAAATFSLRFLAGDAAGAAIVAAFSDGDVTVRRMAVSTVAYRSVDPLMAALGDLMKKDPDVNVRLAAIGALKMKLGDGESVTALVKWAAENDPSSQVRSLAKQVLGAGS